MWYPLPQNLLFPVFIVQFVKLLIQCICLFFQVSQNSTYRALQRAKINRKTNCWQRTHKQKHYLFCLWVKWVISVQVDPMLFWFAKKPKDSASFQSLSFDNFFIFQRERLKSWGFGKDLSLPLNILSYIFAWQPILLWLYIAFQPLVVGHKPALLRRELSKACPAYGEG